MSQANPKRVRMFAGPNGSGKTSLVHRLARDFSANGFFQLHQFINADNLFRDLHEGRGISLAFLGQDVAIEQLRIALVAGGRLSAGHPFLDAVQLENRRLMAPPAVCDAYVAAAIADFLRDELRAVGQSFSFETVMSHRSKIDFFAQARAEGYRTYLYFIATESSHLNISRVHNRAALGGHDVPENKIVERYQRCLELVGAALKHTYRAFLFDNSGGEPIWLAQLTPEGEFRLEVAAGLLPAWFRAWVAPHYPGQTP